MSDGVIDDLSKPETGLIGPPAHDYPMLVMVPMRVFRTRKGNQAHLAPHTMSRILCGTGMAFGEPLLSSEVGHYAGYLHEGRIRLCQSCAGLANRAKGEAAAIAEKRSMEHE